MPPPTASRVSRSKKSGIAPMAEPLLGQFVPADLLEFAHHHLERATNSEELQQRYLRLARFARGTLIILTVLVLAACLLFGAGVAVAAVLAGLPPMTAVGIGAGGTATFVLAVGAPYQTYLKIFFRIVLHGLAARGQSAPEQASRDREESTGSQGHV